MIKVKKIKASELLNESTHSIGIIQDEPITIIKYSNRKLYSKELRAYITLNDLLEYIKESKAYNVYDKVTGEDITRSTTQMAIMTLVDLDLNTLSNLVKA